MIQKNRFDSCLFFKENKGASGRCDLMFHSGGNGGKRCGHFVFQKIWRIAGEI